MRPRLADSFDGVSMADLAKEFEAAQQAVLGLTDDPGNDIKLKLYALYKQAKDGDVHGEKPGFFDFVGTAKYEAWSQLKGLSREEAMQQYIAAVKKLTG